MVAGKASSRDAEKGAIKVGSPVDVRDERLRDKVRHREACGKETIPC